VSKKEIIAAIKKCAQELGHCPSLGELLKKARVSRRDILKLFGNYAMAVRTCGMEPLKGNPTPLADLFEDWAAIVRKLKKLPTIFEYEKESVYSSKPLIGRCKGWRPVPAAMLAYAEREGLVDEWSDVLEMVKANQAATWEAGSQCTGKLLRDRPTYGPPMVKSGMMCGPENENGVLFLFGMLAWQLGFAVQKIQLGFPDGEALRKVDEQTWQKVRIEFEYESRNFLRHNHPARGCDVVVCWIHNWPECPVEVVELSVVEW
jgi:Homing endonuclease associated repeat